MEPPRGPSRLLTTRGLQCKSGGLKPTQRPGPCPSRSRKLPTRAVPVASGCVPRSWASASSMASLQKLLLDTRKEERHEEPWFAATEEPHCQGPGDRVQPGPHWGEESARSPQPLPEQGNDSAAVSAEDSTSTRGPFGPAAPENGP